MDDLPQARSAGVPLASGSQMVIEATGQYPVYPGHPLVTIWQIMAVFDTPHKAMRPARDGGRDCLAAVANSGICAAASSVETACRLIEMAMAGTPISRIMSDADHLWHEWCARSDSTALHPGLRQAGKIRPMFEQRLQTWLDRASASRAPSSHARELVAVERMA